MSDERLSRFLELLREHPEDAFTRYGLAMEYARLGRSADALREFDTLLRQHPEYEAGHFMAAQTLAKLGRTEEAIAHLRQGVAAADRKGNAHARMEMQAMLEDLGG
jgi:predicted Zn-dependent protease